MSQQNFYERTYSLSKLAHQFGIDFSKLNDAAQALASAGFIQLEGDRYLVKNRMHSRKYKRELFKLIEPYKRRPTIMKTLCLIAITCLLGACSSKPKGFILPEALSEVYRNGQLKPMEQADSAVLGMPNQWDRVSHTCTSMPIYDMYGYYVRTDVRCY